MDNSGLIDHPCFDKGLSQNCANVTSFLWRFKTVEQKLNVLITPKIKHNVKMWKMINTKSWLICQQKTISRNAQNENSSVGLIASTL